MSSRLVLASVSGASSKSFSSTSTTSPISSTRRLTAPSPVKDEQQFVFEFINAPDEFAAGAGQRIGRLFEIFLFDFHHIADFVDEEAHGSIPGANHDIHRQAAIEAVAHA